jgi:NTP pyrophosphatase (non-canonical NTP hydrolase)
MNPRIHSGHHPHEPTLADLQQRVHEWISQFEEGYWPPLSMLARLTEEVGELAREVNHLYGHKPKKAEEPAGDIALEVADIIFVLVCLCNSLEIDLGDAFERVMHKYDARDARRWTRRTAAPTPDGCQRSLSVLDGTPVQPSTPKPARLSTPKPTQPRARTGTAAPRARSSRAGRKPAAPPRRKRR